MVKNTPLFKTFHIVISGFLQYEGKPNGMIRLWRELYSRHTSHDTAVLMRTWNDNMETLAEFIWRMSDESVIIKIYGYSWGGAASIKLAKALQNRGIKVEVIVLSDAVYRHSYWLGNWRAFVPFFNLVVPCSVVQVWWYRQKSCFGKLSGHNIVREWGLSGFCRLAKPVWCNCSHTYMDDNLKFHKKALEVAGE